MSVTLQEVAKIAELAKLTFTRAEMEKLATEMNTILTYMDDLSEVDTEGVEPISSPVDMKNHLRADVPVQSLDRETVLMNAPAANEEFFVIPKVIQDK